MAEAEEARRRRGRRTILFIDEIHRFNKAQQDAFLPRVEAGDIVLIGATTENPSFEVNSALLSRSKVYVLQAARRPARSSTILRRALDGSRSAGSAALGDRRGRRCAGGDRAVRERRRARRAEHARDWRPRPRGDGAAHRRRARSPISRRTGRCSTTRPAKSTTTSSRRCTSRCATAIPTRRSTGWRGCSRRARIRSTSRGGWCASRPRTSATPIRRRSTIAVAAKDAVHFIGHAGRQHGAGAGGDLPGDARRRATPSTAPTLDAAEAAAQRRRRAGAAAPAQRADEADEGARLREGLPVRARRGRGDCRRTWSACRRRTRAGGSTSRPSAGSRRRSGGGWRSCGKSAKRAS